ncbi:xanthine dehydrogenase accessory protein XdhC [Phaeobacter sp. CECT 5382]|uniref:XdhC family protein n=1 Tax=Phaeobacter sp. CECT 5382 TaxID=1712645 RepID=UPI0006DAE791|nr:XdhC family protein [Phaeobacter sp. CECT 5382]CUH88041.1 xanthine dehydrogenase accessory protein XdhC [Phaeobacter sp. CECT 5382]
MTPVDIHDTDIEEATRRLRAKGEPFAIATVVRTLGLTAAKPGAKAVLGADGSLVQGWIGGGCVRSALARSARECLQAGGPQLISLHPSEVLAEKGVDAGEDHDGIRFARNGCPSKGSMDIFVEPILPLPELLIYGRSPVALALSKLAEGFQWAVQPAVAGSGLIPLPEGARRMVVVATQGQGDLDCLKAALDSKSEFIAFVGSRRKFAALSQRLQDSGVAARQLDQVRAPAGLAIDAVTPDEIALSILAELIQQRRRDSREAPQ